MWATASQGIPDNRISAVTDPDSAASRSRSAARYSPQPLRLALHRGDCPPLGRTAETSAMPTRAMVRRSRARPGYFGSRASTDALPILLDVPDTAGDFALRLASRASVARRGPATTSAKGLCRARSSTAQEAGHSRCGLEALRQDRRHTARRSEPGRQSCGVLKETLDLLLCNPMVAQRSRGFQEAPGDQPAHALLTDAEHLGRLTNAEGEPGNGARLRRAWSGLATLFDFGAHRFGVADKRGAGQRRPPVTRAGLPLPNEPPTP